MQSFVFLFLLLEWSSLSHSFIGGRMKPVRQRWLGFSLHDKIPVEDEGIPLKQLQFYFDCDALDPDMISEFLFEAGCLSVSCEVASEKNILNDERKWSDLIKTKSWKTASLKATFPTSFDSSSLITLVQETFEDIEFKVETSAVENKDWIAHVQSGWDPVVVDDLTIRFPWHNAELVRTSRQLQIEGGAAFGTGDHPTTRLCCRWIQQMTQAMPTNRIDVSVLDYGCGSGILGLVALIYGASKAVGVDIDKDSLESAKRNCDINGLSMDFYLVPDEDLGTSEEKSVAMNKFRGALADNQIPSVDIIRGETFDLTVANILAPILIDLAEVLASHTKPGGRIALSGLVTQQAQTVIDAYSRHFSDVRIEAEEDGWALVTGRKPE